MQSLLHAQINYSNNSERATVDSDTHKGKNKGAVIKSYKNKFCFYLPRLRDKLNA